MRMLVTGAGLSAMLAVLGCSSETKSADSSAAAPPADTASTSRAAGAMPATGKTWDVKMIGDGTTYRFDPATLTIIAGDAIRWTVVSGPPHNVSFWPDSLPPGSQARLSANMPNQMSPLAGPLLNSVNDTYTISSAGLSPGLYRYFCTPHLALGMVGSFTVR